MVYIHAIDQASNNTDIPNLPAFEFPAEVAVVLRCIALGIRVNEDRRDRAAKILARHCGEFDVEPSSDQLREMLERKADELNNVPPHILLNEKLWQP